MVVQLKRQDNVKMITSPRDFPLEEGLGVCSVLRGDGETKTQRND